MDVYEKAKTLNEALPYITEFNKKIIVVKIGGRVIDDVESIMDDVALLKHMGMNPLVVHGGGPSINKEMEKEGIVPKFVNGLRYTDEKTVETVKKIFSKINKNIVNNLVKNKVKAITVHEAFITKQLNKKLGFVGKIIGIEKELITDLIHSGYIPVISPIGIDDNDQCYNINADTAASEIAVRLKAEKLTILTDVDGILIRGKLQSHMDIKTAEEEIKSGEINKGMIPKVMAGITAVKNNCHKAHLINGLTPHSILMEIFTDKGIGTEIVKNEKSD